TYAWFKYPEVGLGKSNIYCNQFKYNHNYPKAFAPTPGRLTFSKHSLNIFNNYFNFEDEYAPGITQFDLITNDTSRVTFSHNYIRNYKGLTRIVHNGAFMEFKNNTYKDTLETKLHISGHYANLHIVNNIFRHIGLLAEVPSPQFNFTKNQYDEGTSFSNMPGAGIPIATNSNGDQVDTYLNVIEDPKFTKVPLLAADSPMLKAGINGTNIGFYPQGTCLEALFDTSTVIDTDTLSISGQVYAPQVSSIQALVKAINTTSLQEYVAYTDSNGNFQILSLPKGTYYILTVPLAAMEQSYQATYYPKKSSLELAATIDLPYRIVDMRIYLLPNPVARHESPSIPTHVYPNPFKEELIVEDFDGSEAIQITDLAGRHIHESSETQQRINTQSWNRGLYMVKINQQVYKFIKE
ncbi:MAG TPA: T9SS type A sorting domain-containing protein, partial [Cytophagales bacterium]|nr:T9SS type A sorting domain-containing protein [Cytophagales bacterium]